MARNGLEEGEQSSPGGSGGALKAEKLGVQEEKDEAVIGHLLEIVVTRGVWGPQGGMELGIFFFFLFLAALGHVVFPGQGSDPSHSCDLSLGCSNT